MITTMRRKSSVIIIEGKKGSRYIKILRLDDNQTVNTTLENIEADGGKTEIEYALIALTPKIKEIADECIQEAEECDRNPKEFIEDFLFFHPSFYTFNNGAFIKSIRIAVENQLILDARQKASERAYDEGKELARK